MSLSDRLQADLTEAIRERDELRRDTLRMAIAAAYNQEKSAGRRLSDDEVTKVVAREVKTRRESVEAYAAAGRDEAAQRERAEIEILSRYLPGELSEDEVAVHARETIEELGATSPREMGRVMAALMPRLAGRANGKLVSSLVARELARRDLAGHGH
ncbi:MAG TPA: GatB/YqeY domain-containing protein [Candidatus Caenarcaniphilales bacterium]|nr:GatB/YqeY domain-containing protein [Candidatus Caenarcaniphilales bacterium]